MSGSLRANCGESMRATKRMAFIPTGLLALAVDQLAKAHVTTTLEVGARTPLFGDMLALTHVPSMGGALGFFRYWLPDAQLVGFATLAVCATLVIAALYRRLAPRESATAAALGAILGGISSQAIDRLRYGSGLDFLHLGPLDSNVGPDVNLADVAILLGVVTLIVELLATEMAARASERPRH